ncbi:uncharacterized protein LOC115568527 [Sparus aurata]|uniref:uncharacterized protein LOC115568527 n=1 Tax=Sparus aurata TaxID=8175 RepID=UPI0011C11E5A|nr:uncharacterized protein LOC115568527 [Sparus aurata]
MASPVVDVNTVDKVLEEMLKVEADNAQSSGSIKWTSRIQMLQAWKQDIADRHSMMSSYVNHLRTGDSDNDLLRSYHCKINQVEMMPKLIDRYLESEESAMKFLRVVFQVDRGMYLDLLESGPRGKFVRRKPPVVHLTEKVRSALGDKVAHLKNMMTTPIYENRIVEVKCALDLLMQYKQLLPEEYIEFELNEDDTAAMARLLQKLCGDTSIPQANREFISLVVASFNLHAFDLPKMSKEDVLVFVK